MPPHPSSATLPLHHSLTCSLKNDTTGKPYPEFMPVVRFLHAVSDALRFHPAPTEPYQSCPARAALLDAAIALPGQPNPPLPLTRLQVRIGGYGLNGPATEYVERRTAQTIVAPGWRWGTMQPDNGDNDMALLRLDRPVTHKQDGTPIQPIKLAPFTRAQPSGITPSLLSRAAVH